MLEQTRNQMSDMKLFGMLKSFDLRLQESVSHGWSPGDFLSALITDEKTYRDAVKIRRRLNAATLRTQANAHKGHGERLDAIELYQGFAPKHHDCRSHWCW
jgi:DNA replication protein DnaC